VFRVCNRVCPAPSITSRVDHVQVGAACARFGRAQQVGGAKHSVKRGADVVARGGQKARHLPFRPPTRTARRPPGPADLGGGGDAQTARSRPGLTVQEAEAVPRNAD